MYKLHDYTLTRRARASLIVLSRKELGFGLFIQRNITLTAETPQIAWQSVIGPGGYLAGPTAMEFATDGPCILKIGEEVECAFRLYRDAWLFMRAVAVEYEQPRRFRFISIGRPHCNQPEVVDYLAGRRDSLPDALVKYPPADFNRRGAPC